MTGAWHEMAGALHEVAKVSLKAPIHLYRWTLRPWLGWPCRHEPTCSSYAIEAIDRNGAWKGAWLTLSRLARCQPWGTHGYDPVPDLRGVRHPLYAAYRYGRWSSAHLGRGVGLESKDVSLPGNFEA